MMKFKNSDFLMPKRSNRRSKDRAGCMSGIVNIFNFSNGRIRRPLISDHESQMPESTTGSEVNSITNSQEIMHLWIESQNKVETAQITRVKELMEEEMQGDDQEFREISIDEPKSQYCHLEDIMNELLLIHQKQNEEQNPKSLERSNSFSDPKSDDTVKHKHRKFFRRRSKSHECISFENDSSTVSQFSLTEIKKKLKNAIGRSKRDSGFPGKPVVDGGSGRSSPGRDQFYSERFSRISNGVLKSRDMEFGDTSDRISNIYVEAKKHLSEMLDNGDECAGLMAARHPRSLGKLLSFPGYVYPSAGIGSKEEMEHDVLIDTPVVNDSQPFVMDDDRQELEVSDEAHQAKDVAEIVKPPSPEQSEVLDASVTKNFSSNFQDLSEEDELSCSPKASTPSRSSLDTTNQKNKEIEGTSDDRTGKPSPVSVLEPLFSDEDISPARTISRSDKTSIQPLRIRFEETLTSSDNQNTCIHHNQIENEESAFEYVEAVLLASDLNWDEFEKRWLTSSQILDPSLYEELRIFSSRPDHDQLLLFDSINEILKEVCDRSLGYFPELPFVRSKIRLIPKGMKLINEVWERIESRLNCVYLRSLDELISNDLEISRMWIDLCLEIREIVMETEELILEDMIDDTVLSLMNN